jgi:peptidoglycan/xylan/chitin deacetylase (PgdA/CDA1 family)
MVVGRLIPGERVKRALIRSGLESLYFTGAHRLLQRVLGGVGGILTMHHVRPPRGAAFQPNLLLEIAPEFLEQVIIEARKSEIDIVSLDEMQRRLTERDFRRRFLCLTLDDGYRDNREWAYPILKKHRAPFAIYVATSFPEGAGNLWWLTLEDVIAATPHVEVTIGGTSLALACRSPEEKQEAFERVYWALRALPSEIELRDIVQALAQRYGVDPASRCRDLCLTWKELAQLATDPLVTIAAHTVNHLMLRKAPDDVVRKEMAQSAADIERHLGRRPQHFSYPVGDSTSAGPREFAIARELGFATAVTTRPGLLFPEHHQHLTALPRISLNGEFQRIRYVRVLTSGAATAFWNRFKRVDAV